MPVLIFSIMMNTGPFITGVIRLGKGVAFSQRHILLVTGNCLI